MNGSTLILDAFWVSNKHFPTLQNPNVSDGRVFHDYYDGPARHLGWMDLVLLNQLIKQHNITHIILQNLDTLGKIAQVTMEVKVCVSYNYDNFIVRILSKEKALSHCKPIYQDAVIGGWDFSDNDDKLPLRAELYIRYLLIHTLVNSITVMNSKFKFTAHFNSLGEIIFETEPNL